MLRDYDGTVLNDCEASLKTTLLMSSSNGRCGIIRPVGRHNIFLSTMLTFLQLESTSVAHGAVKSDLCFSRSAQSLLGTLCTVREARSFPLSSLTYQCG